ncbi:MAG: thiamine pyrophosphate-binding protein, partial [Bacteroidetes bacterium]|nr:thiamine pyrophosphate-binding protein [Bacteroidota bacterium]
GGFNMNIQELQTLLNYSIPLKTFIMNNQIYGITWQFQDTHFESRYEACGPEGYNPPTFGPIVRAYGIKTARIHNHSHLRYMVKQVINEPEAIVCDVNMKHWHTYEPRVIGWDTPIDDMSPYLSREELAENRL